MPSFVFALILQLLNGAGFILPRVVSVAEPVPPTNTVQGGSVLSDISINPEGEVRQISVREGLSPFADESTRAIQQWKFEPAKSNDHAVASSIGVLMIFRPASFGNFAVGGPSFGFSSPLPLKSDHPPLPVSISDPGYPLTSTAMGVVVFELTIDRNGQPAEIRTVRDILTLTGIAKETLRSWIFTPAIESGRPVEGRLIVAISFLRPVLTVP